jgi:hypothetical protein
MLLKGAVSREGFLAFAILALAAGAHYFYVADRISHLDFAELRLERQEAFLSMNF